MSEGGSPSEAERSKCPIIRSWLDIPDVAARAALGKLADVGKDGLTRECVSANADILEPLIQEFGTLASNSSHHKSYLLYHGCYLLNS